MAAGTVSAAGTGPAARPGTPADDASAFCRARTGPSERARSLDILASADSISSNGSPRDPGRVGSVDVHSKTLDRKTHIMAQPDPHLPVVLGIAPQPV